MTPTGDTARTAALLCERRTWVLNEKSIVQRAGLDEAQTLFAAGTVVIANEG